MLKKLTIKHLVLGYLGLGGLWMVAIGFLPVLGQSKLIPEYIWFGIFVAGLSATPLVLIVCAYGAAILRGPPPRQSRPGMHVTYLSMLVILIPMTYDAAVVTAGASDPNQGLAVFGSTCFAPFIAVLAYYSIWGLELTGRWAWRHLRGGTGPGA